MYRRNRNQYQCHTQELGNSSRLRYHTSRALHHRRAKNSAVHQLGKTQPLINVWLMSFLSCLSCFFLRKECSKLTSDEKHFISFQTFYALVTPDDVQRTFTFVVMEKLSQALCTRIGITLAP